MLFLSINQRGLETHTQLSVTGYELPPRCLMAKSKEGHANVETPGRLCSDIERDYITYPVI
jgi:hypothetical protein